MPSSFGKFGAMKSLAKGMLTKEPKPESTTSATEGEAPVPGKPQLDLSPPPGHPLFMQPPAVRAGIFASISKKKMLEAKEHAELAHKEADKAEDEWRKAEQFATEAAARRDACIKYQYHASLVRSLNRLVGFGARSEAYLADGKAPLGAKPPELTIAGDMKFQAHKHLEDAKADVANLEHIYHKLKEADEYQKHTAPKVEKALRKLVDQKDRFQEIYDDLARAEAIIKEQVPESNEPPFLPKRLLRPNGDPWWPEKPPMPEKPPRLMLVRAYNPTAGFGSVQASAGTKFL